MNSKVKGVIAGVVAAVCYGTNPLGAKFLYADGINTNTVLAHRFGIAMIILGIIMIVKKMSFKVTKREFGILASLGALFAVSSMTLYYSFLHMDAGIASTLLFVYPMMVAIIMTLFFKEKLTWVTVTSILLAFAGIFMLNGANGEGTLNAIGVILVMVSSLTYAVYIVIINRTQIKLPSIKMTFYVLLTCVSCIIIHSFFKPETHLMLLTTPRQYGFALMLAVVPSIMALVLLTVSIRHIGSTPSAILGALEPLTAVMIGIFVFKETFTLRLAGGIVLILSGVLLIILGKKSNSSQQNPS
ncbi:MAG: DMT family transporter [bacterium]|nr:DMT family transporter [Candidatus Limimorpha caballi]MCQ2316217.1 DMT family transporter [Bacteroidales bacterium]